jgi:hypothetical protein
MIGTINTLIIGFGGSIKPNLTEILFSDNCHLMLTSTESLCI